MRLLVNKIEGKIFLTFLTSKNNRPSGVKTPVCSQAKQTNRQTSQLRVQMIAIYIHYREKIRVLSFSFENALAIPLINQ